MGEKRGEKWKRGRAGRGGKFSRIEIPRDGAPILEIWWARVRAPESRDERSARGLLGLGPLRRNIACDIDD